MSDDHKGPTRHRRRRPGIDSVSGKCVVCASSIVAGIAGLGLPWLAVSGLPGTAPATRVAQIKLVDSSDLLASIENLTIVLPGADDDVVLPSDNVINLPFGGDGLNNFFGAGEAGAAGSAADTATGQTWDSFTTPVEQITIPFLNDTIVLPGSNDTFSYLDSLFSGNEINLPFSGGETDIFGYVFGDTGTAASDASSVETATTSADSLSTTGTDSIPSNAIVLPGSADTIVFPSFNTINLPFGGDGENNIGGGGNGGDGGVGTGIGTDGTAAETASTAASNSDDTVTVTADTAGGATYVSGAGETILFPSNSTINFPFGGAGENDFLGGGDGGDGGDGTGIGTGGTGGDVTGIGIGIGGDGGDGGNGAQFFPVQVNFVDSASASGVTVADSSASSSDSSTESLDDFLAGILGSNGTSEVSDATGTAIGIGADGGDGGNGAVIGAMDYDVNTADLSTTQSTSLDGFLDSLLSSSGESTAVAGQAGSTVTDGTSVSIDGSGGAGGSAAEFFPITLDWDDVSGDHSVTVTPVVLLDDMVSYFGGSATDSTSSAGDLGDLLGSNLSTLMSDLSSLF